MSVKTLFDTCALALIKNDDIDGYRLFCLAVLAPRVYSQLFYSLEQQLNLPCCLCTNEDGSYQLQREDGEKIISIMCVCCKRRFG